MSEVSNKDTHRAFDNKKVLANFISHFLASWWKDYRDSFFFVFLPSAAGMCIVLWQNTLDRTTAAMWALACLAAGSLVGFLFGVPKFISDTEPNGRPQEHSPRRPTYLPNTNLDSISDWLTKAIVGVGLVELQEIPGLIRKAAEIAAGTASPAEVSVAMALIVLFLAMGLIGGYVNTRLYFAAAFEKSERQRSQEMGWTLQGVVFTHEGHRTHADIDGNNLAWKCPSSDCISHPLLFVYQSGRAGSSPDSPVTCDHCGARFFLEPPYGTEQEPPRRESRNPAPAMTITRLAAGE